MSRSLREIWNLFSRKHFSPYKVYVRRDLGIVVCLNPKVGSTSFRAILVEGLKSHNMPPMRSKWWPMNETRRYMTASLRDYIHAFRNPGQYQFHCFARNSFSRAISAWNDKLVKGHREGWPRSMVKLMPVIREFARSKGLQGSNPDEVVSFDTFFHFVESLPEGQRNQHWDTQTSVLHADVIQYDHIHKIESEFSNGVCEILGVLGIDVDWAREVSGKPRNSSGKKDKSVLNEEIADRMISLYKQDFAKFGYDEQSWRNL